MSAVCALVMFLKLLLLKILKMANQNQIPYTPGHWTIPDVQYRGKMLTVDLLDGLLPEMTQAKAGAYARANPDDFTARDLPMYFAVFRALEQQRIRPGASAPVAFLRKSMRNNWLQTLTAIDYAPKGEDVVTHGVGTKKPRQQKINLVEHGGRITRKDSACLEVLLGTGDVETVDRVFTFINAKPTYLWTLGHKPLKVDRHVAGFNADYGWSYLGGDGNPRDVLASLGVRRVAPLGSA